MAEKRSLKKSTRRRLAKQAKPDVKSVKSDKPPSQPNRSWPLAVLIAIGRYLRSFGRRLARRASNFRSRRPHRSFYLTPGDKKRRGLKIRGYISFVGQVWSLILKNKWLFTKFVILYAIFSAVIIGLLSQENFVALRDALDEASTNGFDKWLALFSGAITGSSSSTDAGQQVLAVLLFLFGWLTLVWLMRQLVNGNKVKLRDGLYNSGSPVLATLAVVLIILLQLLPLALVFLAYSSISAVGLINSGIQIENMAAWCALAVAAVLTLYWICSSLIALVVVTLPGMYPMQALRAAGDLVVGRRLKLVYRLIFMFIPLLLMWLIGLLPAILIDSWLKLTWQPLVPLIALILTTLTIVWVAAYIYLLYRKMVDDPTPPVPSRRQKRRSKKMAQKSSAKIKRTVKAKKTAS
jgi:uncharacterized membrane protein YidH (DUF202 family)